MKSARLIPVLVLFAFLAGCGGPEDKTTILAGKLLMLKINSDDSSFTRERDGWYHLSATRAELSIVMVDVTSKDSQPQLDYGGSVNQTDTDLPERSAGDFHKVKLTREGKQVYLEERLRMSVDLPKELNFETKAEVEFTRGDWFEYEAGQPVSFRLSKAGMKTSRESAERQFEEMLTPSIRLILLEELKRGKAEGKWTVSDADLGRLVHAESEVDMKAFPNTVYSANGKTISFSEKKPAEVFVRVWMGITTEHLENK